MSYLTPEQARAEQLREGRNMARCDDDSIPSSRPRLTARPDYVGTRAQRPARPKVKGAPTGHEAFLKALHESGAQIVVYMRDEEEILTGKIRAHDKYTISLEVSGDTHVIFKHAIQRFKPLPRPRVQPAPVAEVAERAEEGHYQ
jgi:RNA chaperone Hfq